MRDILARVRYLRKPLLELRTSEVRPRAVLGTSGYGVLRTSGVGVRGFGAPAADRFARLPPPQLWLRCSLASRSDVDHRCVRSPFHHTLDAVGRESGQFVLVLEPTWLRLFGGSDHRKRFVPKAPQSARLGGGNKL